MTPHESFFSRTRGRVGLALLAVTISVIAPLHGQSALPDSTGGVDLTDRSVVAPSGAAQEHVLARPWYDNVTVSGFGAFGFVDSGRAGVRPDGGFQIKEATVHVEMDVWQSAVVYVELQTNRLGSDDSKYVRTGEVHAHFRDLLRTASVQVGAKVGRIDIPFGDEYLWQDAPDNPLISNSASYPYGWDEGVLVYGRLSGLGWIAAITDGTDERSAEDDPSKAINLKFYGEPVDGLTVSTSLMRTGAVGKSAIEFGGSHFQPVGASHSSTLGASLSERVEATLLDATATYRWGDTRRGGRLIASYGGARQQDADRTYDRDLRWTTVEALGSIGAVYAVVRHSEIGTYDSQAGFHLDGKPTAGGNAAFGYDVRRFRRTSVGAGWDPNPRVRAKAEVGQDRFYLIEAAPAPPGDDRWLLGLELAVSF